jgi:hypothetical protein
LQTVLTPFLVRLKMMKVILALVALKAGEGGGIGQDDSLWYF